MNDEKFMCDCGLVAVTEEEHLIKDRSPYSFLKRLSRSLLKKYGIALDYECLKYAWEDSCDYECFCCDYFWEHIEDDCRVIEQPKRKPLPDGTLPLTDKELVELTSFIDYEPFPIRRVKVVKKPFKILIVFHDGGSSILDYVKAILYLNTLFDLNMEAKSE